MPWIYDTIFASKELINFLLEFFFLCIVHFLFTAISIQQKMLCKHTTELGIIIIPNISPLSFNVKSALYMGSQAVLIRCLT